MSLWPVVEIRPGYLNNGVELREAELSQWHCRSKLPSLGDTGRWSYNQAAIKKSQVETPARGLCDTCMGHNGLETTDRGWCQQGKATNE